LLELINKHHTASRPCLSRNSQRINTFKITHWWFWKKL